VKAKSKPLGRGIDEKKHYRVSMGEGESKKKNVMTKKVDGGGKKQGT